MAGSSNEILDILNPYTKRVATFLILCFIVFANVKRSFNVVNVRILLVSTRNSYAIISYSYIKFGLYFRTSPIKYIVSISRTPKKVVNEVYYSFEHEKAFLLHFYVAVYIVP